MISFLEPRLTNCVYQYALQPINIHSRGSERSVHLKCGNIRIAFLAICMVFWIFSLVILCQIAAHNGHSKLGQRAHSLNDYFGNKSVAFMAGPVVVLVMFLYFNWGRKKLSWFNGVIINDQPIDLIHYQFKRSIINVPLIYL